MPIYEYFCPACNGQFQKLVRGFSDPPGLVCPRCGNTEVRRAISRFATLKSEDERLGHWPTVKFHGFGRE